MKIIIFFVFLYAQADPSFHLLYDLGSHKPHLDLSGQGPEMWSRSSSYQNGVRITSYKKWINITSRLPLQFKLPKNSSTTILTVIKPTQCPHSKLLAWIYLNTKTPLNPKCGLVCYNNFEWKLGCIDLYGRNYLSDKIYLGSNKQIAIGISYYNSDGYLTMNLMWKSEKEDPKSFEYVTNIYYYDFFNNNEHDIKATYGSYPGYLYFFGLTKEKIELSTFLSYVGAENYGEIIPVCVDCRYFKCPGLDVHILPHKPRNYYCTCPTKMAQTCNGQSFHMCLVRDYRMAFPLFSSDFRC